MEFPPQSTVRYEGWYRRSDRCTVHSHCLRYVCYVLHRTSTDIILSTLICSIKQCHLPLQLAYSLCDVTVKISGICIIDKVGWLAEASAVAQWRTAFDVQRLRAKSEADIHRE